MIVSFSTIPLIRKDVSLNGWVELLEDTVREIGTDVAVLPEYAWGRKPVFLKELKDLFGSWNWNGTMVAGSAVLDLNGKKSNQAIVVTEQSEVVTIPKGSPMYHERKQGIKGMHNPKVIRVKKGINLGILICADLWHHSLVDTYLSFGIDVLAVPTMSITLPNHEKYARTLWYSLSLTRSREFVLPIIVSDYPSNDKNPTGFASAIVDPSIKNERLQSIEDFLVLPDNKGITIGTIDFEGVRKYRDYRIKEGLLNH